MYKEQKNNPGQVLLRYGLYLLVVSCATFLVFGIPRYSAGILEFICMLLLVTAFSIEFPRVKVEVSMAQVVMHVAAMIFPPIEAAWISALGSMDQDQLMGRARKVSIVFNRLQLGAGAYLSSAVFHGLRGYVGEFWAFVISGVSILGSNLFLIALFLKIIDNLNFSSFWREGLRRWAPSSFMVSPISYLMLIVYRQIGFSGLLIFIFPLLATRYALEQYVTIRTQFFSTIRSLMAALEARDEATLGHSDRVSRLAVEVARELGLNEDEVEKIQVAAILHDIGKIGIPDAILKKAGRYTEAEFQEMARHPIIGERIVANSRLFDDIAAWVRHHHERFDGRGYPDRLKGEDIPLGARIITVVDAFDAMTSTRPYKERLPLDHAIAELERGAGSQFDPHVVAAACRILRDSERRERVLQVDGLPPDILTELLPEQRQAAAETYRLAQHWARSAQDEAAAGAEASAQDHGPST